ncbi:hypothetical protein TTHERM_00220630 (macronuclear) [Tetrahymena thermophila SB210]|uniref:Tetratricopeptide repeat protein n=1 Tax=Tetrahymena thermophila (strain SB210) TaxID=312017 RepID=I7M2H3_TETTS|nr:hypothetical protein TTHERM_00220630 [Tetrahymena thermophila SB210]EAS00390.2 hypothetical protein TTHERM_00220630 [Tetrahymena thermophila SB210]|eukprot:XP_001020635.2 hypothetical protein TTHERM_00220630 [Tetrahymena thermophila SB210]
MLKLIHKYFAAYSIVSIDQFINNNWLNQLIQEIKKFKCCLQQLKLYSWFLYFGKFFSINFNEFVTQVFNLLTTIRFCLQEIFLILFLKINIFSQIQVKLKIQLAWIILIQENLQTMKSIVSASELEQIVMKSYRSNDFRNCLNTLSNYKFNQKSNGFSKYFMVMQLESHSYSTSDLGVIQKYIDHVLTIDEQPMAIQTLFTAFNGDLKSYFNHKWKFNFLFIQKKYKDALLEMKNMHSQLSIFKKNKLKIDLNQEQLLFLEYEKQEILLKQSICEILFSNCTNKNQMNNLYTLLSDIQIYQNASIIRKTKFYRFGLAQWNFFNCFSENDPQLSVSTILNRNTNELQNLMNESLKSLQSTLKMSGKQIHQENDQKQENTALKNKQIKLNQKYLQSQEFGARNFINFILSRWQVIIDDLEPIILSDANDGTQNSYYQQQQDHEKIVIQLQEQLNKKQTWLENKLYYLVIMGICYEQTQNYEKAKNVYEKLYSELEQTENNTMYDLIKLNLANCYVILGSFSQAKRLIEETICNTSNEIFQIYNKSMMKLYFEKDYEEALGLLSYLETQMISKNGIFDHLLPQEELILQKAISLSKCGDQASAITCLENFQISCNFSSIISISILSFMIQEYSYYIKKEFNQLNSVDMVGRLAKTLNIQANSITQKFLQGFVCTKLQKTDQGNIIFKEIVEFYEKSLLMKQNTIDLIQLQQIDIFLYSYCFLLAQSSNKKEKKEMKASIEKIQIKSEQEIQIIRDLFLFVDVKDSQFTDLQNQTEINFDQILPALLSVLISSIFLNQQHQQKYYESIKLLFFDKFNIIKEMSRQRQQSSFLESSGQNNIQNPPNNFTLFSFGEMAQIDKSTFLPQNSNIQNTLTFNKNSFDKEELQQYQYIESLPLPKEYCNKMFELIIEISEFYKEFKNYIEKNWTPQQFTFSKINADKEEEITISLQQTFSQFTSKHKPLIILFYNEIAQSITKLNDQSQINKCLQLICFKTKQILTRINFILSIFQQYFQPNKLALKLTILKLKSKQGNLNLKEVDFEGFQSFFSILSSQPYKESPQAQLEALVFQDLTLLFKELLINQDNTQIINSQSLSAIIEQVISTKDTSLFSLNQFYAEQQQNIFANIYTKQKQQNSFQEQINNEKQNELQSLQNNNLPQNQQIQNKQINLQQKKKKKSNCKCVIF